MLEWKTAPQIRPYTKKEFIFLEKMRDFLKNVTRNKKFSWIKSLIAFKKKSQAWVRDKAGFIVHPFLGSETYALEQTLKRTH